MSYNDSRVFSSSSREAFGDFILFLVGAALVIGMLLGVAIAGKHFLFPSDTPPCIKHHQQVEQVDSYGKKEAVTVCDQFKGEPVKVEGQ